VPNNANVDVYGADIMALLLQSHAVHLKNVAQRQVAANL